MLRSSFAGLLVRSVMKGGGSSMAKGVRPRAWRVAWKKYRSQVSRFSLPKEPHRHGQRAFGAASDTQAGVGLSAIGRMTIRDPRLAIGVAFVGPLEFGFFLFLSSVRRSQVERLSGRKGKVAVRHSVPQHQGKPDEEGAKAQMSSTLSVPH